MSVYRLWPATPGNPSDEATAPISLGTEIALSAPGWATGLHFWRATLSEVGPVTGAVYAVASGMQVPGTAVTFTLSGTGWHTATLPSPIQLSAGVRYIVVIHHTNRYAGTAGYWATGAGASGITNGILTAPPASTVTTAPVGQGRFSEGPTIAAPTGTFNGGCYWADVSITDDDPAGLSATGSALSAGSVTAGRSAVAAGSGSAATTGLASAVRTAVAAAAGSGSGSATAAGVRLAVASSTGSAESTGSAVAGRSAVAAASGAASTTAVALGRRTAVATAAGGASGSGVVDGDSRMVLGGAVSSGLASIHPLIRRPRRGIIHRP